MKHPPIIDAASHILEPSGLWENGLKPCFRDRPMRILKDKAGLEYLSVDGRMSRGFRGGFGAIAAFGKSLEWQLENISMPYAQLGNLVPGAVDPHERVKYMDQEGVDLTFVYPTLGIGWEGDCDDPQLSANYCRVYNDWIVDFCKPCSERLAPIAHISLRDVDDGVKELNRVAQMGAKGAFVSPAPVSGIPYGHPSYQSFWATAQDLEMPITLHIVMNPNYLGRELYADRDYLGPQFFLEMMIHVDPLVTLATMMIDGVLERFPRLRLAITDIGCSWVARWLEKLDVKYESFRASTAMKMKPSEYFQRQCWVGLEPNEKKVTGAIEILGVDRVFWGSDYPHQEGYPDAVNRVKAQVSSLSRGDQQRILGENALEMYGLSRA